MPILEINYTLSLKLWETAFEKKVISNINISDKKFLLVCNKQVFQISNVDIVYAHIQYYKSVVYKPFIEYLFKIE